MLAATQVKGWPVCSIAAAAALASAAGCTRSRNAEAPILQPQETLELRSDAAPAPSLSATTLDRSHWRAVTVTAAQGEVSHAPAYFNDTAWNPDAAYARDYPTAETALHDGAGAPQADLLRAAIAPLEVAWQVVWLPVAVVLDPPWTINSSPAAGAQRTPEPLEGENADMGVWPVTASASAE